MRAFFFAGFLWVTALPVFLACFLAAAFPAFEYEKCFPPTFGISDFPYSDQSRLFTRESSRDNTRKLGKDRRFLGGVKRGGWLSPRSNGQPRSPPHDKDLCARSLAVNSIPQKRLSESSGNVPGTLSLVPPKYDLVPPKYDGIWGVPSESHLGGTRLSRTVTPLSRTDTPN